MHEGLGALGKVVSAAAMIKNAKAVLRFCAVRRLEAPPQQRLQQRFFMRSI